ncbi:MAG: KH domain-containing protein [Thermoplasmata archaeon]
MKHFLRIPKERIGAMIGPGGRVKREVERRTGVKLEIDSETGEVTIDYSRAKDPALVLKVNDLVRAIGRGFSPQRAFRLLRDDCFLMVINIQDYIGKSPSHLRRMRARVIGTGGKTRRIIEELSETELSIYGDTVSVIGDARSLEYARTALDMLLCGSEHSAVYAYLEHTRRERKLSELSPPEPREEE